MNGVEAVVIKDSPCFANSSSTLRIASVTYCKEEKPHLGLDLSPGR